MQETINILLKRFLQKQASSEEVMQLKKLFTQGKAEEQLSGFYEETWEQVDFTPEKEVEQRIWMNLQEQIHKSESTSRSAPAKLSLQRRILRIAATILIPLLCGGLGYYYATHAQIQNTKNMVVQVEVGQKAKVQLPDGTSAWLNSAGSLTYDNAYNRKERIVYLQGEAYFEVNEDKTRPFIVKVNDVSVEALGTKFSVKAYPMDNYITATLIEGSVRVNTSSHSELLKPDEKLTITKSNGQFTKVMLPDAEKSILWINNQLAFEQERLENIAKILERMYNVHISFTSDKLKNIRFSGTIKNNNMENVLQSITLVSPISYSIEKNATIIIRDK